MLASGSAWRILVAEHNRLRQLSASIHQVLDGDGWRQPGPQLQLLRRRIVEFQDFEAATHRPKGVVLMDSMRGRSEQADQFLEVLDHESQHCDELLARALALLDAIGPDGAGEPAEVVSLLRQHGELLLGQLDREDTVLRSYTAQLLTNEEWSAVVSSISSVVQRGKGRQERSKG